MRKLRAVAVFGMLSLWLGCGGGSGGSGGGGGGGGTPGCTTGTSTSAGGNTIASAAANVAAITVDGGLPNTGYVNGVFVTVKVCAPGTTNCQNIDHVLVDTGSYGLRLLSNAGGGTLTTSLAAALPQQMVSGSAIAECAQFSDGITWGPIKMADIHISGESATSVPAAGVPPGMPVQIIGDPGFSTVPSACTSFGTPEDSLQTLLANGIVGVGPFPQDCGFNCTLAGTDPSNPGLYYACPSGGCNANSQPTSQAINSQVWNPVAAFTPLTAGGTADNNGVILELPGLTSSGLPRADGSLVFGINTQSNNALGNTAVHTADPSTANITTTFGGQTLSSSFIDSGSNGYFFPSNIQTCTSNSGFYCPTASDGSATSLSCSATNIGANAKQTNINFNVANIDLGLPAANNAFNDIAGPNTPPPGSNTAAGFDWGLPFFYGRNVYTGMANGTVPTGVQAGTPFYAY